MSKFVVLEGMDGSGKSTQAKLLADKLREAGGSVCLTAEPSAEPIGKLIRERIANSELNWMEMSLLFAADRMEHLRKVVRPAIEAGQVVVCDRYWLSTFIYQTTEFWKHLSKGGVEAHEKFMYAREWITELHIHCERPDVNIVIDVPFDVAIDRLGTRIVRDSFETVENLRRVHEMYGRAALFLGDQKVVHVDGSGPEEDTHHVVLNAALEVLAL